MALPGHACCVEIRICIVDDCVCNPAYLYTNQWKHELSIKILTIIINHALWTMLSTTDIPLCRNGYFIEFLFGIYKGPRFLEYQHRYRVSHALLKIIDGEYVYVFTSSSVYSVTNCSWLFTVRVLWMPCLRGWSRTIHCTSSRVELPNKS